MKNSLVACLLGLLLFAANPTYALDADSLDPESVEAVDDPGELTPRETAEKLLAEIDQGVEEINKLRAEMAAASGEQRETLLRQYQDEQLLIGNDAHEAAEIILAGQEEGLDLGETPDRVVGLLKSIPEAIERILAERTEIYNQRLDARESAEADKALEAEQDLDSAAEAVDEVLRFYVRQIQLMESFDLDTQSTKASALEQIIQRADNTATRLQVNQETLVSLQAVLSSSPDNADAMERKLVVDERIEGNAARLRSFIDDIKKLDGDTTDYQKLLVTATGDVGAIGFDLAVLSSLFDDWIDQASDWLADNAARLVLRAIIIVAILIGTWMLAGVARRLTGKALDAKSMGVSQLLRSMLIGLVGNVIRIFGVLVALSQLGISVGPMLAGLGIAGFILGFALQDTLSNFASGIMILFYRPFDVGDFIESAGISGKVDAMNLVSTTVLTFDNQTLIVPNNKIWGDVIRNVTRQTQRRVDLVFGVSYTDDMDKVEGLLAEILEKDERVLDYPESLIKLHELADSSVNYIVRPWVKTENYWDVYWDLTREVKRRFDAEGISIPFPQRDVHHYYYENTEGRPPATGSLPGGPKKPAEKPTDWKHAADLPPDSEDSG